VPHLASRPGLALAVEVEVGAGLGPARAHATIRTGTWAARRAEADQRALTRSLDAGR